MSELILDQSFLDHIDSKYAPAAEARMAEVEALFTQPNQAAIDNLTLLFQIVGSPEFARLADALGPIPVYDGILTPLEAKDEATQMKAALVPFGTFQLALYYGRCLSLYHLGRLTVQVDKDLIQVGEDRFTSPMELYFSDYRFFFAEFGQSEFHHAVKTYLRKVGVIDV